MTPEAGKEQISVESTAALRREVPQSPTGDDRGDECPTCASLRNLHSASFCCKRGDCAQAPTAQY